MSAETEEPDMNTYDPMDAIVYRHLTRDNAPGVVPSAHYGRGTAVTCRDNTPADARGRVDADRR
jgi:hypothetical protein